MKAAVSESGFTLIESIFTIAIIAIAMTGLIAVWSNAVVHSADPYWQSKSVALGKIYLAKIKRSHFSDLEKLQTAADQTLDDYQGFKTSFKVSFAGSDFALSHHDLKKVVIKITAPQGTEQLFVTYKGSW
ncbi:MAG: prepilin-type N-terminal cleavage/methylation domain-containing protein [Oceanospirillaceae bacterium]